MGSAEEEQMRGFFTAFRMTSKKVAGSQDDERKQAAVVCLEAVEGFQEITPRKTGPGTRPRSCVSGCLNAIG